MLGVLKLGTYWTCYTWLPRFLQAPEYLNQPVARSAGWIVTAQLGQLAGMLTFGVLADRYGQAARLHRLFVADRHDVVPDRVRGCAWRAVARLQDTKRCSTYSYRMALSLRLDADTERLVNRLARSRRQTKSEVLREAVRVLAREQSVAPSDATLYDAIAHQIGCFDSGGANLSRRTGERFTTLLVERGRARRPR